MIKRVKAWLIFLIFANVAIAAAKTPTGEQLKLFDSSYLEAEKNACHQSSPGTSFTQWLTAEVKNLSGGNAEGSAAGTMIVKYGHGDPWLLIPARREDCSQVAASLALMKWLKDSGVPVDGTAFGISPGGTFDADGFIIYPKTPDAPDFQQFIKDWIKADENPGVFLDLKAMTDKAQSLSKSLRGEIDGDLLKSYGENLHLVLNTQREGNLKGKFRVATVLKSYFSQNRPDPFSSMAAQISGLKEIHDFAQRGLWDQATGAASKLKENFPGSSLDPTLQDLQKGRDHLDEVLESLEKEIDLLSQRLNDEFVKMSKSLSDAQKI